MKKCNLILLLMYRYVDDIRCFLRPINFGWYWGTQGWYYDQNKKDTRTVEEIKKSMNAVWNFLEFTTESQTDFTDGYLPTLDFATKVLPTGYVSYKFFSKPMGSNLVLSFGTALSRSCIFSSLR